MPVFKYLAFHAKSAVAVFKRFILFAVGFGLYQCQLCSGGIPFIAVYAIFLFGYL